MSRRRYCRRRTPLRTWIYVLAAVVALGALSEALDAVAAFLS